MAAREAKIQLYRIFLGTSAGTRELQRILSHHFDGFTIVHAEGFWKGQPEKSRIISVTGSRRTVVACMRDLKRAFGQERLMLEQAGKASLY